jgi:SAM-dependent methyltransferase
MLKKNALIKKVSESLIGGMDAGVLSTCYERAVTMPMGIEIDPIPHKNGFPYFLQKGYKPQEFLFLVSANGKTMFPDNYFDIVFSEQVIEHVSDLDGCIAEISRIAKPGAT